MRAPALPADWPYRSASRHVLCQPHLWHVQDIGAGPTVILLHGAGGATHSFRHMIPLLAPRYRVIAIDLPGQGFTRLGSKSRCGLDAMAEDIAALCAQEAWHPFLIIGHSAGAAIALRLAEMLPVAGVVGINAALGKFDGLAGWFFPVIARLLALTPLVAQAFSKFAGTPTHVRRLLASTGSRIEPAGEAQYLRLLQMPSHVDATLAMMSQWTLDPLLARLPGQVLPCLLITSSHDRAVPPSVSQKAALAMPDACWVDVPGYGHLVHEEAAVEVVAAIDTWIARAIPHQGTEGLAARPAR